MLLLQMRSKNQKCYYFSTEQESKTRSRLPLQESQRVAAVPGLVLQIREQRGLLGQRDTGDGPGVCPEVANATLDAAGKLSCGSRDGHTADPENSENKRCLESFFVRKECSDGAGNRRNRKISSRRSYYDVTKLFKMF